MASINVASSAEKDSSIYEKTKKEAYMKFIGESGEIDREDKIYKLTTFLLDMRTGTLDKGLTSAEIDNIKDKFYNSRYAKEHSKNKDYLQLKAFIEDITSPMLMRDSLCAS